MSEPVNLVETQEQEMMIVETFRLDGDPPTVGYMLECPGCKRKIIVEAIANSTDPDVDVVLSVTCGECVNMSELKKADAAVAGKIAVWLLEKTGL